MDRLPIATEKVLVFRPREVHQDSVKQQSPPPEKPGRLVVFPTWDPMMDSMLSWAARTDLALFLRWRRETGAAPEPKDGAATP